MPDSNVSSCVLNILGSFSSSLGLYKKVKEQRRKLRKSRKHEKVEGEEELRLSRSLRQGPEDISLEYQKSLWAVGDQFAIGDAIAQTSLAEVLLRLNVGLVGIVTSFVHSDKNNVQLDYRSLADLAERSRIDTCRALRQLFKRLTHFRVPKAITSGQDVEADRAAKSASTSDLSSNRSRNDAANKRPKIRGTTLAQVVIQDSSKPPQIALVRPGERRKKSHASSGSDSSSSRPRKDSKQSSPVPTTPPPDYASEQSRRPSADRAKTSSDVRKPHKQYSRAQMTSKSSAADKDLLRSTRSTPRLQATLDGPFDPLPQMPCLPQEMPALPLTQSSLAAASTQTLLAPRRQRKPTPTFYSIATDSTKLGEIPLHKWAQPYDFDQMSVLNREAYRKGWPIDEAESGKKRSGRGRFLGLFRRRSD